MYICGEIKEGCFSLCLKFLNKFQLNYFYYGLPYF